MKFPLRSDQWPYFGIAFTFLLTAGIGLSYQQSGLASTLASDSHAEGEYFVSPESAEIDLGGSYTFTTYTQASTRSVRTSSDWHVEREADDGSVEVDPLDVWLEDCESSSTCTIHAGAVSGELTVVAENGDESVEASLTIDDEWGDNPYTDEVPTWAAPYIYILRDRGLMTGYADGSFGAANPVTRGQFTLLYYRIMEMVYPEIPAITADCDVYDDVTSDHYAYEAICFAYYGNWFDGTGTGENFNPNDSILRKDVALVLSNTFLDGLWDEVYVPLYGWSAYSIDLATYLFYEDVYGLGEDYVHAIGLVSFFELMTGTASMDEYGNINRYFNPDNEINRAETAVIMGRFIEDLDL